ncbi:UDP-N-acetylmuramoyl-L-alanine--D-glutamate ligase [soil metagenome]
MYIGQLKNKKILILGYGKEGKATEQYLKKSLPECEIGIADKSQGDDYLQKQSEYDIVIKTPGIQKQLMTVPYTTATNIFFANKGIHPVIGVTGSKGKSTTASLIFHILQEAGIPAKLVGNIGNPALQELIEPPKEKTYFIYELSSYQLDDIEYSPHISIIVSLFPEHMNYHGSEENYYEAKKKIIEHVTNKDFYVYNPHYSKLHDWSMYTIATPVLFETDFVPESTALQGNHNLSNIRGAITVARMLNISDEVSAKAIHSFKPLPHRLQKIGEYRGITFYDDAISTTPESTIAALEAIPQVKTILLGGEDRGYKYDILAEKLQSFAVEHVVLFPETAQKIKTSFEKIAFAPHILETENMEKAVKFAYKHTPAGAVCMLSTAAPSYSLWQNFEEKGDQFQLSVSRLGHD